MAQPVVMSWLPGIVLGERLTEANMYKMGVLLARLHQHGARFTPPEGFTQLKLNGIYARGEEDILFGESCQDAFTPYTRDLMERTRIIAEEAFARLYADPTGLRVIHDDLWHDNIKLYRGRLYPFDFEDTAWGYPVQDFAAALQDLMVDVSREAYEPLAAALRAGYESLLPWPEQYEGQIDQLRAGRLVWMANYVARFERPYLREHIEWLAPQLAHFLATGRISKPGA